MSTRQPQARASATGHLRPKSPAEALEPARAPSRPRTGRDRGETRSVSVAVRVISGALTFVLGVMVLAGASALLVSTQLENPGPLESPRPVVIRKGEGRIEIATRLESEGVIASRYTFIATNFAQSVFPGFFKSRRSNEIKAGEYEIPQHASIHQVLDTLVDGRSVAVNFTAQEGLTSYQIVERLKAEASLTGDIDRIPAEGTLRPETYRTNKGGSRADILEHMRADQQKLLAGLWETRAPDLPFQTIEQAVVLASIVEKETGGKDERPRVAAVFMNRLRRNMPLQSDPTILYGLYGGAVQWGKPILRSEIDAKTAHNTYQIRGLPPTPICNPSKASLEAVLNPAKTNDLYFVANGEGGHVFTDNLKDHNAAVANWRKHEKEVRAARQAEARAAGNTVAEDPDAAAAAEAAADPEAAAAAEPAASAQPAPAPKTVAKSGAKKKKAP